MMTRKDFIEMSLVAVRIINKIKDFEVSLFIETERAEELKKEVTKEITGFCAGQNGLFDINKFTRALKVLNFLFKEEYKNFNWRNFPFEEREKEKQLRESDEFKVLLLKALNTKLPKEKFIITKDYNGNKVYLKSCRRSALWSSEREKTKVFDFKAECENVKKCYPMGQYWGIEELNKNKLNEVKNESRTDI